MEFGIAQSALVGQQCFWEASQRGQSLLDRILRQKILRVLLGKAREVDSNLKLTLRREDEGPMFGLSISLLIVNYKQDCA